MKVWVVYVVVCIAIMFGCANENNSTSTCNDVLKQCVLSKKNENKCIKDFHLCNGFGIH